MASNFFDINGYAFEDVNGKIVFAKGTTVPVDTTAGYITGCLFLKTDGSTGTSLYVNEGSTTSSDFNAFGARASKLTDPFDIEGGTYDITVDITTQTIGTSTLTIPDFANVNDTFVFTTLAQTFTNKSFDCDGTGNALTNINGQELDSIAATVGTYGVPVIIPVPNAGTASIVIFNANAPFKFRVIDAWAVSTKASNSGTWVVDNGTSNITSALAYGTADTDISRAVDLDDAYCDIAANGTLRLTSSVATDTAIVYIAVIRID